MRGLLFLTIAVLALTGIFFIRQLWFAPSTPVDSTVSRFLASPQQVRSFKADSLFWKQSGQPSGKTVFVFDGPDRWEMMFENGGRLAAHWLKIDSDTFVKDLSDGYFWDVATDVPTIGSQVDFRVFADTVQKRKDVTFSLQRQEPCGEVMCAVYWILDPFYEADRERITHQLWLDVETGWPYREDFSGDTGVSTTYFSEFNQSKITSPSLTKKASIDQDVFILPDSFLATPPATLENFSPVFPFIYR